MTVERKYLNKIVGVDLSKEEIEQSLLKMGLWSCTIGNDNVSVSIPFYWTDILHPCDIAEDVAVGYGFNNIPLRECKVPSNGK